MSSKKKTTAMKEAALVPKMRFPEFRVAPNYWSTKPLGELADFSSGGTPSKDNPDFWNGHIPWISASSMHTTLIAKSDHHVSSKAIGNGTRIAPKGSFLILVRGSMLFNRVPMGIAEIDVAFNQDVKALAPNGGVNTQFLLYFLSAVESQIPINETGIGAGKIDTDVLKGFPIPIPKPAEQKKIAECLSSVDELMAAQGRKVDALKTHKKGLMQRLFPREGETQPRLRFPEFQNAGEWEDSPLGAVCELYQPVTLSSSELSMTGEYLVFGANGVIGTHSEYNHEESEIAVTCRGATCGEVTTTQPKSWITGNAMVVKPRSKKLYKDFIFHYFKNHGLKTVISGSAQPQITRAGFAPLVIFFPEPEEQERIATCLSSLDALITAETQKLEALKTHKRGLMQQLFPSPQES